MYMDYLTVAKVLTFCLGGGMELLTANNDRQRVGVQTGT